MTLKILTRAFTELWKTERIGFGGGVLKVWFGTWEV